MPSKCVLVCVCVLFITYTCTHIHYGTLNLLLDVHGEVSLDGSLGDESTGHAAERLPGGQHAG